MISTFGKCVLPIRLVDFRSRSDWDKEGLFMKTAWAHYDPSYQHSCIEQPQVSNRHCTGCSCGIRYQPPCSAQFAGPWGCAQ